MRKQDLIMMATAAGALAACALLPGFTDAFISFNLNFPYASASAQFALLATFGECLGARLSTGAYLRPGFGLPARALLWALCGLLIKLSLTVYSAGVPVFLAETGLAALYAALPAPAGALLTALSLSLIMNLTFQPFFMTLQQVLSRHLDEHGGSLGAFAVPVRMARGLAGLDWSILYGFVFKKTLPLFWVPAHTITFLLPLHFQVLFAAGLGVALGVIMALAGAGKNAPKTGLKEICHV